MAELLRFTVEKDGVFVGTVDAADARLAGQTAVDRFGAGIYEIRMVLDPQGPTSDRARILAAKNRHQAAIEKHRSTMNLWEIQRELDSFVAHIDHCESAGARSHLEAVISFVSEGVRNARRDYDNNPRSTRYVDIRTPYLEYAIEALDRRFPSDPQTYDRGERDYINAVSRGGAA